MALPVACDRFDLNDIGAEIAEALRAKGPAMAMEQSRTRYPLRIPIFVFLERQCITQPPSTLMVWPVMKLE